MTGGVESPDRTTESDPRPIGIVVSRSDRVAERILEQLLDVADWSQSVDESRPPADGGGDVYRTRGTVLRTVETTHLHLENARAVFDADVERIVFPSRHAGDTGPLLTAHFTGNVGTADHGGTDRELARGAPLAGKRALAALDRHAPEDYEVSLECTHHGPSAVGAPSLFVELGSGEPAWSDADAARAVARAVLACRDPTDVAWPPDSTLPPALPGHRLVGFGGGHYAPRFTRIARETSWAVGHVAADWGLEEWTEPDRCVIEQLFEKSGATLAIVDGDRPALESAIERRGYRTVSETWVRAVSGVALDLVAACVERLCAVEAGLRFGTPARERTREALERSGPGAAETPVTLPDDAVVEQLPGDLLAEVAGIDSERTLTVVSEHALAYDTTEAGNRPAGRVLLESSADSVGLIDAVASVLEAKYDRVDRNADAVVAERSAFDPERAATLGVPEGPAFGRLAAGESVTVDGREIDPEVVASTERRQFPL
jgi:D-aminoacyl-tRNA deacylase